MPEAYRNFVSGRSQRTPLTFYLRWPFELIRKGPIHFPALLDPFKEMYVTHRELTYNVNRVEVTGKLQFGAPELRQRFVFTAEHLMCLCENGFLFDNFAPIMNGLSAVGLLVTVDSYKSLYA